MKYIIYLITVLQLQVRFSYTDNTSQYSLVWGQEPGVIVQEILINY